jgi:hypothetical protein
MLHPDLIRSAAPRPRHDGGADQRVFPGAKRIEELNRAGLDFHRSASTRAEPDEASRKPRVLDKLQHLKDHAAFDVNINSVLGGIKNPGCAPSTTAPGLGFSTSIGIIHDGSGRLKPLGRSSARSTTASAAISGPWQVFEPRSGITSFHVPADGKPNDWRCRAGGRYLYICEEGLVHYCSQQRGYPGTPLEAYTLDDIRREFATPKSCAPYCTVGCVHRVSTMDFWRSPQDAKRGEVTAHP